MALCPRPTTAESGKAESRQIFETLAANDFAELPFREMWLVSVCFLAEAASVLGDARSASVLYQLMLPYAERVAVSYPEISTGSVARYLGNAGGTTGRLDDAVGHFEQSLEVNARIGASSWLARAQADYDDLTVGRGDGY